MNEDKRIFFIVISAPSGTGKSSICKRLLDLYPSLMLSISFTSRVPRMNETNGKEYHFISREEFQHKIESDDFIEWVEHYGNFYGTSKTTTQMLFSKKKEVLFDIEPHGAKKIKEIFSGGVFIFIMPPSLDELRYRLIGRQTESFEQVKLRLAKAEIEMDEAKSYDHIVVNHKIDDAVAEIGKIYLKYKHICKK